MHYRCLKYLPNIADEKIEKKIQTVRVASVSFRFDIGGEGEMSKKRCPRKRSRDKKMI